MVTSGVIRRNAKARLLRDGAVVADNLDLSSLRREKDDATEVREGFECGLVLRNYKDIKIGDIVEAFEMQGDPARLTIAWAWPPGDRRLASSSYPECRRYRRADRTLTAPGRRPMSYRRVRKIADRIQVIVAEMLERRIKDARLGFVTVTDVRRHGGHPARLDLLHRARRRRGAPRSGARWRRQGTDPLRGRQAARHAARPVADFILDALPESAAHIDDLLAKARQSDAAVAAPAAGVVRRGGRSLQEARARTIDDDPRRRRRRATRTVTGTARPDCSSSTSPPA